MAQLAYSKPAACMQETQEALELDQPCILASCILKTAPEPNPRAIIPPPGLHPRCRCRCCCLVLSSQPTRPRTPRTLVHPTRSLTAHAHKPRLVASSLSDHPKLYTYITLISPLSLSPATSDFLTLHLYHQLGASLLIQSQSVQALDPPHPISPLPSSSLLTPSLSSPSSPAFSTRALDS